MVTKVVRVEILVAIIPFAAVLAIVAASAYGTYRQARAGAEDGE
jgi:hypothetical protein